MAARIVGQQDMVDGLLSALVAGGHILLEGAPGLAKTLAVKCLAAVTGLEFKRIQFTPDLLPADLTGTLVWEPDRAAFSVRKGPVFTNIVLADEINRAPAKVQSALLEAMEEYQVTIGEQTWPLRYPFFVQAAFAGFSEEGFLKEDALVNPGYNASAQQNPYWTVYHSSVIGVISYPAQYYIPSVYILSFYDGSKLTDAKRGALLYRGWPSVPSHQLGNQTGRPYSPGYIWHIGTGAGLTASDAAGILKSRSAPAPLFFAFEAHFLLAEAALYGLDPDGSGLDAKAHFENGVKASFDYLEREGAANSLPPGANPQADAEAYISANSWSYLVNFDLADSHEKKLEAIITQKYIASNILNANEAWNEFRRTGYPAISGSAPRSTFVSVLSQSTRADKLPVRLIYPQSEYNLNANTPKIEDAYSNPIFWDKN